MKDFITALATIALMCVLAAGATAQCRSCQGGYCPTYQFPGTYAIPVTAQVVPAQAVPTKEPPVVIPAPVPPNLGTSQPASQPVAKTPTIPAECQVCPNAVQCYPASAYHPTQARRGPIRWLFRGRCRGCQ